MKRCNECGATVTRPCKNNDEAIVCERLNVGARLARMRKIVVGQCVECGAQTVGIKTLTLCSERCRTRKKRRLKKASVHAG